MPYETPKQARFIHAKASEGIPWAKDFVRHSHGMKVRRKRVKVRRGRSA